VFQDFLVPFVAIALAEMGDKTQIAMMAMAAKYRHTFQIFIGAMAASAIVDGSAVVIGSYISRYVPRAPVSIAAAALFIGFGIFTLMKKEGRGKAPELSRSAVIAAAFMLFFVSEFGDKSQFAALLFGTQYNILLTLLGTLSAIGFLLMIMLTAGRYIGKMIDEKALRLLSGTLFIGIGILTLARLY